MSKFIDLTGERFGRLVVLRYVGKNHRGRIQWLCECDCGNEKTIVGHRLKSSDTKSCGCLRMEQLTKHGHSVRGKESKTYKSWENMIQRCTNPKNKRYQDYGGRGITVCKGWFKFENFLKDMGEAPEEHQIDRIDNNKGYCKSNCRWVTRKEQQRNTRNNHLITFNDKTQCVAAWAEEFNIHERTLNSRLCRGLSVKEALTTPIKKGED